MEKIEVKFEADTSNLPTGMSEFELGNVLLATA